jgi:predicted Zn-dependent protease with MMP-like domain
MERDEFAKVMQEVLDSLPEEFRAHLKRSIQLYFPICESTLHCSGIWTPLAPE